VATGNTASGLQLSADAPAATSSVTVRSSRFLGNTTGVTVLKAGPNTNHILSGLNLGDGSTNGLNTLNDATTPNTTTGICVIMPKDVGALTLTARGNIFGATKDCTSGSPTLTGSTSCAATG